MENFLIGLIIGIVGAAIASYFIAKNNKDKLIKSFGWVDSLPKEAKDLLKKYGVNL